MGGDKDTKLCPLKFENDHHMNKKNILIRVFKGFVNWPLIFMTGEFSSL